jgi:hypothetical protein
LSATLAAHIQEPRPLVGSLYNSVLDVFSASEGLVVAASMLAVKINDTHMADKIDGTDPNRKSNRRNLMAKLVNE